MKFRKMLERDPMDYVGDVEVPYPDENFGSIRIVIHLTSENLIKLGYDILTERCWKGYKKE
jgi:hypothetical protein